MHMLNQHTDTTYNYKHKCIFKYNYIHEYWYTKWNYKNINNIYWQRVPHMDSWWWGPDLLQDSTKEGSVHRGARLAWSGRAQSQDVWAIQGAAGEVAQSQVASYIDIFLENMFIVLHVYHNLKLNFDHAVEVQRQPFWSACSNCGVHIPELPWMIPAWYLSGPTNLAIGNNPFSWMIYLSKNGDVHSYVSLLEGENPLDQFERLHCDMTGNVGWWGASSRKDLVSLWGFFMIFPESSTYPLVI